MSISPDEPSGSLDRHYRLERAVYQWLANWNARTLLVESKTDVILDAVSGSY
jgi:hypothetical protein